tara:strand:+ start:25851 stop:26009 length:159 start_codon:yes stop_codon:yes gene_type:complete
MLDALHILASALMAADHKELIRPEEERLPKKYPFSPQNLSSPILLARLFELA